MFLNNYNDLRYQNFKREGPIIDQRSQQNQTKIDFPGLYDQQYQKEIIRNLVYG